MSSQPGPRLPPWPRLHPSGTVSAAVSRPRPQPTLSVLLSFTIYYLPTVHHFLALFYHRYCCHLLMFNSPPQSHTFFYQVCIRPTNFLKLLFIQYFVLVVHLVQGKRYCRSLQLSVPPPYWICIHCSIRLLCGILVTFRSWPLYSTVPLLESRQDNFDSHPVYKQQVK